MDHVAIMNKRWKLIGKILDGSKTIESRWYVNRIAPWDRIHKGERVYFKDAGCPVTATALVSKVLQFENLTKESISDIYEKYGVQIGTARSEFESGIERKLNKNYCILIFLEKPHRIEPFDIDKTGFGNACAWLYVEDIKRIKK